MSAIDLFLQQNTITSQKPSGITLVTVSSEEEGTMLAKKFLYSVIDKKTVLFLSGGSTPKNIYTSFAREALINPGAVAMVDERYGEPLHNLSNQLMIKNTGFLDYLAMRYVQFYPILTGKKDRVTTAREYDEAVRYLIHYFQKKVAILGVGEDGHTAGIAPNRVDFTNPLFLAERKLLQVSEFHDTKVMSPQGSSMPPYGFGERITLTLHALSQMDILLVLAFGEKKREALKKVFTPGKVEEIPLRFVQDPQVALKTIVITDQKL